MDDNILVIGIAGGTGSGKTTLMNNLISRFEGMVTVISHDNYYKRHDDMTYEERSQLNYDEPAAFDTSLMVYHLEELRRVDPAALLSHVHPHEAGERAALILGRILHGLRLRADQMRRRHVRVAEDGVLLQLLNHRLVLFGGLDGIDAEGHDFHAAQVRPFFGKHVVERLGDLRGVPRQRRIADAHFGDLGERGLERRQQLALELAVDLLTGVVSLHVAADVGVKEHRVGHAVAVFAEAANGDIHIEADVVIHHAEGHRAGRTVFVAHQLLGVEVIDALIHRGLAAEGKALADVLEHCADGLGQIAAEQRRRAAGIVGVLTRLGAHIHDLALLHDHGTLAVGNGHDGAVGDNVVIAFDVGAASALAFPAAGSQQVSWHGFTIKVFLPLVGHNAASSAHCSSDKSHNDPPISGAGRARPILYR